MSTQLEPAPKTQPNGDEITDEMVKAELAKYLKMAQDRGLMSGMSSPLGNPDNNGPQNSQAQAMKDCLSRYASLSKEEKDQVLMAISGKTSTNSAPTDPATETLAQALFSEKSASILKIDKDFPIEIVSKLSIPTADKVSLLGALVPIAERQQTATETLRKEFMSQLNANTNKPKLDASNGSTPGESNTGVKERVAKFATALGADGLLTKSESK